MGLMDSWFRDPARNNRSGMVQFSGIITLGAGGAIATGGADTPGFSFTKVGAKVGRYLVQILDSKLQACGCIKFAKIGATVETASADAAYTVTKGAYAIIRNRSPSTGTFQVQLIRTDSAADAEAEDSAVLHVWFSAKRSSAVP